MLLSRSLSLLQHREDSHAPHQVREGSVVSGGERSALDAVRDIQAQGAADAARDDQAVAGEHLDRHALADQVVDGCAS